MVFHSKTEKQQHCKNHAVKALQQCTYCGKQFRYACHRREHEKNHTMDEKLNCLFCKSRFSKRVQLAAHIHQVAGSQLCRMKALSNKKTKMRDVRETRFCKGKVDQEENAGKESVKLSCGVCRKVVTNKFHLRAHEVILHRLIKTGLEDSDAEDGTKSTKDGNCKMDTGDIGEEDEGSGGGCERSGGGYERSGGGCERSEEDCNIRVSEIGWREEQSGIVKLEWQESMELSNEIGDDLNNDTGAIQNDDEASFPMDDTSIVNVMLVSICEFCDRTFRSEKGMLTHQKKKHKNTKEPYMCPDCPQTFAARAERDTHLLQHLSMRPYQCRFCPKRFKKAHHCREHELLHDVSSQIKCTYCEKGFTSNRYLLKHQLGTRSKTPLMCKICSKYFALKPCLMYHEKVCGKEDASSTTTSTCSSTASRPPDGAEVEEYGRQRSSEKCSTSRVIHDDAGWNDDSVSLAQRRRDKCRKPTLQPGDDVRFVKYLEGMIDVHLRKELDIQDDDGKGKSTAQRAEEQKDRVFKCKFCAVIFDTQVVLVKHEFLHTKKQDMVCWFCNLTFKTEELKTEHESSHDMNHLCQQCGTYFRSRTQMENHDCKNPHSKTEYSCERCIEKFSNPLDLLQHEGSHVGRRTYKCTTCKACFVNNDSFEYHMEREHGIVSVRGEKSRRRGFYSCRYCRKWFYKQSSLQMHEKGHTWEQAGMNLYTCFYCKDTFPNRTLLLKHEEDTHAAKRPYQCRLCGHRFISECKLQEHAIRHRESEYQCECCPRNFSHDFELFKHEKAHPDLKKYSCRSCDERFACDLNRMFHARRQHNATYPCPLCGQSLMTSSALARHLIEHKKKNQLPSKCHKFAEGRETSSPKSPVPKNLMSHPADSRLVRGPLDGSDNAPSVAEKRSNGLSSIEAEVARLGNDCTGDVSDLKETKESGSNSSEYKRKLRTRYPSRNTTSQQDANEASTNHVGGRKDDQSESDEMFEIFRCKFCGKDFEDQKNCVHHEKLHSDKQWKCVTHMTSYITKEQMNHVEREHVGDREGDQSDSVDILELSACKFCGKNFEDEKNCFQHELLHSPEKQWKCESCMTSYFTKKLLMDHIQKEQHKTHVPVHVQSGRNEERQKAVCKIDFGDESVISIPDEGGEGDIKTDEGDNKSKSSLVNDESKPGGVIDKTNTKFKTKPSFDCIYCFRKFGSRIAYKKHKKSHGGPKPYRCRYCRDTFGQTKQRDKHETGHYKERPYKCGHCSWQFKRSWHRNDHEKIHIEAAQMKCEACTYRFEDRLTYGDMRRRRAKKADTNAQNVVHISSISGICSIIGSSSTTLVPSWKGRSSKKTTVHTKETTVHTKKTTVHTKKTTVHTKKTTVYAKKTSVHTKKVVNIRKKAAINTRKKVARRAKIDANKRMTELSKRLERDDKLQNDNREKDLRAKIDAKKRMTELSKKLESSDKLQNDNRRNDLRAKIDAKKRMTELSKALESGDKLQNDNREKHFDNLKLGENVVLHYSDIQHECHLCYKRFESLNHIWKHEKVHTGVKRLKCHKCHSAFFNKGSLHYHLQTKHRASLQCAVNYPPVENTRELSQRIVIHYPETQLKCELCDEKFRILSQIWGHEKMHGGFKSHKCPKCIARFFNKGSVNYHLQKEHRAILERITALPPSENTQVASFQKLECGKCHKLFSNKNHLDEHKRLHDPNLQFRCEVCDKSFTRPIRLLRHEVTHRSGKKKYQCSHCQTGFFSQDSYDYHVKRHHTTGLSGKRTKKKKKYTALQQKQKIYECPHCSKTFGNAEVAKRHEASHSHLLRYGCTYPGCDVRCASQVLMEQHVLNTHHSDRPYQCSFCPKTFKTVGHFAYHEKRHQPEKLPYVCEVCNKGFVRPRAVFRHERSHAGEKKYKCLDCPLQCHNMVSMMYHKLSKHGITYRQQGLHKLKDTWKSKQNSSTVNANFVQQNKTKRTFLRRKGQLDVSPQKAGRIGVRKLNSFDDSNMTEADFTKSKVKDGNYDTGVANSEDQSPDVEEIAEDTGFICELCTEEFNSERELRRHKRFHSVEIKAMQSLFKHNDGATQEEYSGSVSNPIRRKAAVEDVASGKRGRGRPKGTFRSSKPRKPSIPGRGRGRPKGTFKSSKLKKSSLKTKSTRSKLILQRKRRAAFRRGITRLKTSQKVKGEPDVKEKVAKMLKQLSWDTGVSSDTNPIVEERFRIRSPVKKDKLGQKEEEKKEKEEVTIVDDDDDDDVVEIPIEKSPRVKKNIQNGHVFGKSPKRRKDGILFVRKEAKSKSPKHQKPSKFLSLLKETEREREDGMAFVSRLTPVLYNGYCRSCIQCGKRFDTDETLAEHQKWHTCSKAHPVFRM
ncbi:LOW QUALITY PROTEIN: uncharacterized protein [Amphiura filiformis]|uniref:LOW QUALITY PROTEIN: uncharacterized protein n=1 Tax=Amphiura filiformis TaxID=82378 RepID=UPI003B20B67C